jgi:hypothetical protein
MSTYSELKMTGLGGVAVGVNILSVEGVAPFEQLSSDLVILAIMAEVCET